jgi:hypothetical protein
MWSRHHLAIARITSRLWQGDRSQAGFAVPLALGLGLVMIIVAASMIGRSQSDRTTTNFQRETNRALGVSEAGVIRVQLFLDRHKLLANQNLDEWVDTLNLLPAEQKNCSSLDLVGVKQQAEIFKNHNWINLDNTDINKGRYQIVDYKYQAGIGTLTLAGEIDVYNTSKNTANSTLAVEIPIGSENAKIPPPGLWARTFKLDPSQQINGQIRAVTCPQITDSNPDGVVGIDQINIAEVNHQPTGQIIADPFTAIPQPKTAPNNFILLPAITSSIELPRAADTTGIRGEYHYLVDIDSSSSEYSINLKDDDQISIKIAADQKVNLYLKGNISLGGGKIVNVNANTAIVRIYGSDRTLKLMIKDNASITAFIHAPFADAQSVKSSSSHPNQGITGAVWVKSWDSASSKGKISIIQAGSWPDFGIEKKEQPSQLSPIGAWQRVESILPTKPNDKLKISK